MNNKQAPCHALYLLLCNMYKRVKPPTFGILPVNHMLIQQEPNASC